MTIRDVQHRVLDGIVRAFPVIGLDRRAEYFTGLFEKYLPRGSRVLDIGGGWGFYAGPLERRGHEVIVLDVRCPGYQLSPVVLYDGQRIPFADQSFDVSLLITTLHHVPAPEALIAETRRVTRSRLIVVEDLYHHSLGRYWTILRDQIYNFEFFGHPCNFKKREEWLYLFQQCGFSLLAEQQVYTWLLGMRILNGVFIFEPL